MIEAMLVNLEYFSSYAKTLHGFLLGMVFFILGYTFISIGNAFWKAVERDRVIALVLAILLYLVRLVLFKLEGPPHSLTALESICWMLSVIGFGAVYLNKSSTLLTYLNKAVYPVYIVHMPVQYFFSYHIVPLSVPAAIKFLMLHTATYGVSVLIYERVIKRIKWIKPMFVIK